MAVVGLGGRHSRARHGEVELLLHTTSVEHRPTPEWVHVHLHTEAMVVARLHGVVAVPAEPLHGQDLVLGRPRGADLVQKLPLGALRVHEPLHGRQLGVVLQPGEDRMVVELLRGERTRLVHLALRHGMIQRKLPHRGSGMLLRLGYNPRMNDANKC